MSGARRLALTAAAGATAVVLAMADAISGPAGLADTAAAMAIAGLLIARVTVGLGEARWPVRARERRPAVTKADFPGYGAVASDISWAGVSQRNYARGLRRRLDRLAAGKAVAIDDPGPDEDAPGPDLAAIERMISRLEDA